MLSTNCKNYIQRSKNIGHVGLISDRVCTPSSIFDQQHKYLLRSIMQDCLSSCLGILVLLCPKPFKENYLTLQIFSFNTLSISYEGYLRCLLLGRETLSFVVETVYCNLVHTHKIPNLAIPELGHCFWLRNKMKTKILMYNTVRTIPKSDSKIVQVFQ